MRFFKYIAGIILYVVGSLVGQRILSCTPSYYADIICAILISAGVIVVFMPSDRS